MSENSSWQSKIRFFSKFLGYDFDDFDETLDQSNKSQLLRRPPKGIKVIQMPAPISQSMVLPKTYRQQHDKKWLNLIRMPYSEALKAQLLKMTYQGTCSPNKIMPWLSQNKHKINSKLYNIKKLQYRACLNSNNYYFLQKMSPQVQILTTKLNSFGQPALTELLAILMLYREDVSYSDTLLAIGQTVYQYLFDSPVMALSLLCCFCCTGCILPFIINDIEAMNVVINQISKSIKRNCSSAAFLIRDHIPFQQYIRRMIATFWLDISQQGREFRQKILFYLLINKLSLKSISKVCQATIQGLSRIINQGNRQKSIEVLNNPRIFLDEQVFLKHLFFDK